MWLGMVAIAQPHVRRATSSRGAHCGKGAMVETAQMTGVAAWRLEVDLGSPAPMVETVRTIVAQALWYLGTRQHGLREVRRGARVGPTLVVLMAMNEMEVEAVVDTGAEVTIVSEGFYQKLSGQEKRPGGPHVVIHNAEDGASMEAAQVEVRVRLGAYEGRW